MWRSTSRAEAFMGSELESGAELESGVNDPDAVTRSSLPKQIILETHSKCIPQRQGSSRPSLRAQSVSLSYASAQDNASAVWTKHLGTPDTDASTQPQQPMPQTPPSSVILKETKAVEAPHPEKQSRIPARSSAQGTTTQQSKETTSSCSFTRSASAPELLRSIDYSAVPMYPIAISYPPASTETTHPPTPPPLPLSDHLCMESYALEAQKVLESVARRAEGFPPTSSSGSSSLDNASKSDSGELLCRVPVPWLPLQNRSDSYPSSGPHLRGKASAVQVHQLVRLTQTLSRRMIELSDELEWCKAQLNLRGYDISAAPTPRRHRRSIHCIS